MGRARRRLGARLMAIGWIAAGFAGSATARQEPEPDEPEGAQILTQGPIHEAFAQPVLYDPRPGPVVPQGPPAPIVEVPPEQKPEGADVRWIPGYWAWDDARDDFLWVSGTWRAIPPGRQWIPGYWQQVEGGSQWVPGYWGTTDATQVQYLPEPPASLESGPASPPPEPEATWSPGMWAWQGDRYAWRPGFWVDDQPGWMWVPASNSWTPNGYVTNPGYWDYPLADRGLPFAPVYFARPTYARPDYRYTPSVGLMTSALASSLFVRPSNHSYYFGDYYAPNNFRSGIYPWYAFHGSRHGYDPLYAYAAAQNARANPRWADELHEGYRYRREHPESRPPGTFAQTRTLAARPRDGSDAAGSASNLVLARPLSQLAAPVAGAAARAGPGANAPRFERIDEARRQELGRQAAQLHPFGEDRRRRELDARRTTPPAGRSVPQELKSNPSPIVATPRAEGVRIASPAMPPHPEFDRAIRPAATGVAPIRHEPRPESRPPVPPAAPARPAAPGPKRK